MYQLACDDMTRTNTIHKLSDIFYIPVSGLTGVNLKDSAPPDVCPWYKGPPFITYLDDLPSLTREDKGPFRMPIADKYKVGIIWSLQYILSYDD